VAVTYENVRPLGTWSVLGKEVSGRFYFEVRLSVDELKLQVFLEVCEAL
jgi:hypothetical protein